MKKRSVTIRGHATSVTLEEEFWQALARIAARETLSVAALVARIDEQRNGAGNLSSAVRVFILKDLSGPAG